MDRIVESAFSTWLHILQAVAFVVMLTIAVNTGYRYYDRYTTRHDIENFMIDMLDYASTHNGFNAPTETSGNKMTFADVQNRFLTKYKLQGKIQGDAIQTSPAANQSLHYDRLDATDPDSIGTTNISITVTPMYLPLNPMDKSGRHPASQPMTLSANIRGYVKTTNEKDLDEYYPHITGDKIINVNS